MDLDPLAAAVSAQEYVEKALDMQQNTASEKSDTYRANSFVDYKSVKYAGNIQRPPTKLFRPKNIDRNVEESVSIHKPRHRKSGYRNARPLPFSDLDNPNRQPRTNHDEVVQESSMRIQRKRPRQHNHIQHQQVEIDFKTTSTTRYPEIENHQIHKKHKLNFYDLETIPEVEPKRVRPKMKNYNRLTYDEETRPEQQTLDSSADFSNQQKVVNDWHAHFNVPKVNEEAFNVNAPLPTKMTTKKSKKRIRTKRPLINSTTIAHFNVEDSYNQNYVPRESFEQIRNYKLNAKPTEDSEVLSSGQINLKIEPHTANGEELPKLSQKKSYTSKSKTVENADFSTSTNYYYEPILTEVVEEPQSEEFEISKKPQFSNKTLHNLKLSKNIHTTPANDFEAYYMTHPTPSPPTTSSSLPSSYRPKPFYHPTPPRQQIKQGGEAKRLNASIFINSNNGVGEPINYHGQEVQETRSKQKYFIKSHERIKQHKPQGVTQDKEMAESQLINFHLLKNNSFEDRLKPHTPQFNMQEPKETKAPVYYGNFSPMSSTVLPLGATQEQIVDPEDLYKGFFSSTVASIIENTVLRPVSPTFNQSIPDYTDRSLMTYAPEDDIDMATEKIEIDPLETSESGKNQYVVLYEVEEKPKLRRPRPRHRTTSKPQSVTQQIHYHHHGNPSPPTQKYNQGGSYQGSIGAKRPFDSDNDEGPDVTHTHHEYVHFDNEPSVTHLYNQGPMTDHYQIGSPGANAMYDLKSARDYDFRHTASHDLDTKHVPVPDYNNLRYSHMHNAGQHGRVEQPMNFNSYGERPFYYYDSERNSDLYDLEAYGSSPQQSVVKPFESDQLQVENQENKLKITDPLNPTQTIEITKDEYVRHVKLAVEKYLKSKEQRTTTSNPPISINPVITNQPLNQQNQFFNGGQHNPVGITPVNENEATVFLKTTHSPSNEIHRPPLLGYQKPLERPLNYHEGHILDGKMPLNDDAYRHMRETLEGSYAIPVKPITLPPKKNHQLNKFVASTPSAFQPRPIPPIRPQHPPQNFNIMKYVRYPKGTYSAGKPLTDAIYNMQESMGNDVDLTNKHFRQNGQPPALDVGQSYLHGTTHLDTNNGHTNSGSGNFGTPNHKLKFNQNVYQDINSLQQNRQPPLQNYKDAEHAQSTFSETKTLGNKKRGHNVAQNSATFDNELQNAPVQIINGVPVSNPYNIDMDTLR